jgi:hypothetical protein
MTDDRSTVDERAQGGELNELDEALEAHDYPITPDELIESHGDYRIESSGGSKSIEEIFAPIDDDTYDSAEEVRDRVLELLHRE